MNQLEDNEIGLFDFFETVWDGRLIISLFVFIALSLGSLYINLKDPEYESVLIYASDTLPPFDGDQKKIFKDFQKIFYNEDIFNAWKIDNKSSPLNFDFISTTQAIDNIKFSKHEDKRTVIHEMDDKIGAYILVRSNEKILLDDLFEYANHVNTALTTEYIQRAKDEINIMYKRFNDPSATTDTITRDLLEVDRYIVEAEKGDKVLHLMHPTYPEKVSPRTKLVLVISFVLGVMIAIIYIFFRDAYRSRNMQSTKTSKIS